MAMHKWAREMLDRELAVAGAAGMDEALALRALLSEVVERSKAVRPIEDLAQELCFLADNLDDDRDYAFMRP